MMQKSSCSLMIIFFLIFVTFVTGFKVENLKVMTKCNGKDAGMSPYYEQLVTALAPCLTESAQACRTACGFQQMGVIDEKNGKFQQQKITSIYNQYFKVGEELKQKIIQIYVDCFGEQTFNLNGRCTAMRTTLYCVYNKYIKVCDRNRKPLNVNVKSEEEGVVGEVVGLGLSRGLPEAPASLPKQNATSS